VKSVEGAEFEISRPIIHLLTAPQINRLEMTKGGLSDQLTQFTFLKFPHKVSGTHRSLTEIPVCGGISGALTDKRTRQTGLFAKNANHAI